MEEHNSESEPEPEPDASESTGPRSDQRARQPAVEDLLTERALLREVLSQLVAVFNPYITQANGRGIAAVDLALWQKAADLCQSWRKIED